MPLATDFLETCLRLAEEAPERGVPSPSSVNRCTRHNWLKARGEPRSHQPDNGESYISAETGRASEPLLRRVVEEMGLGVCRYDEGDEAGRELTDAQLERVSMVGGQVDNIADGPDGPFLVEFKRKGVFGYLDVVRRGVREGAEDDFVQMQSLMHALELEKGLYVVANYDRSALTAHTRKWDKRPDGVHVEWVQYSRPVALAAKARAEMQRKLIEEEDDPRNVPRDFNPFEGRFPCTWCPVFKKCQEVG